MGDYLTGNSFAGMKHNIFLTYCHEIVGVAMKWLVQQHFPLSDIGEAQNFQKAITDLPKREYDLFVLDAEIGGGVQVLGTVKHIKSISPKTRILIFSELDEAVYAPKYLAFGINGFLPKNADIGSIVKTIKASLGGGEAEENGQHMSALGSGKSPNANPFSELSNREKQIVELLVKGAQLTDIGKSINLKETTVSTYKKRVFKKIGVKTLSDLISMWKIYG